MDLREWSSTPSANIKVIGFSPWTAPRLLNAISAGTPISGLPGDFVLIATRTGPHGFTDHLLVSSVLGARPYFILRANGPCHGENVYELVANAGIKWDWNLDALRSVAWLGHTVGEQSLHLKVSRLPADSIFLYTEGGWQQETQSFWSTVFQGPTVNVDDAVDIFGEVADEIAVNNPLLSLSAGFDSRALLSRLLATGRKPETITMGFPDSTDVLVAQAISADEGLAHHAIALQAQQYLPSGPRIAQVTGGTKTIGNWHTYLYPQHRDPVESHLVGSNGEFARCFYLDRGTASRLAAAGRTISVRAYWAARIGRRSRRMERFLPFLSPRGTKDHFRFSQMVASLGSVGGGDALQILDRFYATHRVRHFIGNGLALYAEHGRPASPFLDARWIAAAARLPARAKLGSNYHRRVIERNTPRLLNYPTGGGGPMGNSAHARYWRNTSPVRGFSPIADVFASPAAVEILHDSPHLEQFVDRASRTEIAAHGSDEAREYLLTLHFAAGAASAATLATGNSFDAR